MFYMYIENGIPNGVGEVIQLDENVLNIEISEEIYNNYSNDPLLYCYSDDKIIINPDYEILQQKQANTQRKLEIEKQLEILDAKRIRAICENEIKDSETNQTWLDFYNSQIIQLRTELQNLQIS